MLWFYILKSLKAVGQMKNDPNKVLVHVLEYYSSHYAYNIHNTTNIYKRFSNDHTEEEVVREYRNKYTVAPTLQYSLMLPSILYYYYYFH